MISSVFVYGTLQRGQCRESMWPVTPISIVRAWTRGTLFGREDYPAMVEGKDRVLGECWQFDPPAMHEVLRALDIIEGTNQPGSPDLYRRLETDVWDWNEDASEKSDQPQRAWTYHYASDPRRDGFEMIRPNQDGPVCWPQ